MVLLRLHARAEIPGGRGHSFGDDFTRQRVCACVRACARARMHACVRVIVFFSFLYSLFPPFLNCYPAFFVKIFLLYILVLSFCLLQSLLSIDLFVVAFNLYTLLVTRFCHNFIALSEINSLTLTSEKFTNTGISVHCAVADRRVSLVYVYTIYSEQ